MNKHKKKSTRNNRRNLEILNKLLPKRKMENIQRKTIIHVALKEWFVNKGNKRTRW